MSALRARARELRKDPTDAERLLWRRLRYWQLDGCKFRRQQPLGPYIVDFVCLQRRLVIELDGGQHAEESDHDTLRDDWLRSQSFTVLRFWNNDVIQNTDAVVEKILEQIQSTPYLNPSPQGGRKRMRKPKPEKVGA